MSLPNIPRPVPMPDRDTAPFWEAANNHELRFQRCTSCQLIRFPVLPICPGCHSFDAMWELSTGRGEVYSYTTAHYQAHPDFPTPYTVLLVQMDDGPRVVGRLEAPVGASIDLGDRVKVGWDDLDGQSILRFELER